MRQPPKRIIKDFAALMAPDNELISKFNAAIDSKTSEINSSASIRSIEQEYDDLCTAITYAIQEVLPTRRKSNGPTRAVSQRTKDLFDRRTEMGKDKGKWSNADFKRIQRQIRESSLRDHAEWVERCADDMQSANDVGNTRGLYNLVKTLSGKVDKKPEIDLNEDSQGNVISNAKERAAVWYQFLKSKFAATAEEHARPSMEQLGRREATDVLTKCEVAKAVANLKNNKAVGADGIPVEVYKVSASAFNLLHKLLARVWKEEQVPEDLGVAVFKMLYKRKGSPNDPSKYRCIGLLNSAYKVLSAVMLNRITRETAGYLQDWQAGFRQNRGCRDNVMILRTAINKRLKEGKSMILTFIDYSAAFDSVGHKFLDEALGEASAKPKTRAIFRSVYGLWKRYSAH